MAKYKDEFEVGNSDVVPFKEGETASERHERRKNAAAQSLDMVAAWCGLHDIELLIANDKHHWRFLKGKNVVEWWPSSAKMVVNKKWKDGLHVHDYKQVIAMLTKVFVEPV
jgi:hypothetical protein